MEARQQSSGASITDGAIAQTARLDIRHLRECDAELIQPLANNWEVAKQTINLPHPYTIEDARRLISAAKSGARLGKEQVFAISPRRDGAIIGLIGLVLDVFPIEVGYWIGSAYWGQGYATEALCAVRDYAQRRFSCARINAMAFDDNAGSIRVLIKSGFRHVEDVREDFPGRGGMRTVRYYGWRL